MAIDLHKAGETAKLSLEKGSKVVAKLRWDSEADLDLYCFYVDIYGNEDKVYYRDMGSTTRPPYIQLMGDSTTAGEEVIEIARPDQMKYILIAAYSAISNGVGSFFSYKARAEISDSHGQTVTTHLSHKDPFSYWVALAKIDLTNPYNLSIENVETYANKKNFKKGFIERTGEKPSTLFHKAHQQVRHIDRYHPERSPHLFGDGSFMMSVGKIEFK